MYLDTSGPTGALLAFGASAIRRIVGYRNTYNASLHFLASLPVGGPETDVAGREELLFGQFSWQPRATNDLVYLNTFWAMDQFTSPARGTLAGGPLVSNRTLVRRGGPRSLWGGAQ